LFLVYLIFKFQYDEIVLALTVYFATAYRVLPSVNRINTSLILMKQYEYLVDEFKKFKNLNIIQNQHLNKEFSKLSFNNIIKLFNVSLSYSDDKQKKVLNAINLEIKKSEVLGIIGESGSGKTTLMYIIAGLISPDEGFVEVDGEKINENNVLSWHKHISIVFQEPYIIDGNWIDNIAFGGQEIDENKIWECLRLVQLENYVKQLPNQLYETLGENGSFLSGGQKQRLAIARALYREADVLLLDEATSALDEDTQLEVMQAINNIRKERQITVVIIAHRYSSLKFCNRIVKLDKGVIQKELRYQDLIDYK
jgi:ABC-type multidrug transport system fused ATPase/permease subunit